MFQLFGLWTSIWKSFCVLHGAADDFFSSSLTSLLATTKTIATISNKYELFSLSSAQWWRIDIGWSVTLVSVLTIFNIFTSWTACDLTIFHKYKILHILCIRTCSMTNTMVNTEMINTHAAMAIAVIAVVAGVMRPNALLPFTSLAVLSFPLMPNRPSSPPLPPPNCCCWMPFAMRRLPAGDAFMHPPENNWQAKKQKQNQNE